MATETTPTGRVVVITPRSKAANWGDRVFRWSVTTFGVIILVLVGAIAYKMVDAAMLSIRTFGFDFLIGTTWDPVFERFGTLPFLYGTLVSSAIALLVGAPIALGAAIYLAELAPDWLRDPLSFMVELLAAIPSVVYGLWGVVWLAPRLQPVWEWLASTLGFIPLFAGPASQPPRTLMTVGLVLAVMILPIITAVSREVFLQTPRLHEEAALALGATRWEMIRMAVLPFGRSGLISASMLGLGRALGETMAVLMILSPGFTYSFALLQAGRHQTIAANIANQFPEANPLGVSTLIATGLALFVITLAVNMAARWVVSRRKDFSGAN